MGTSDRPGATHAPKNTHQLHLDAEAVLEEARQIQQHLAAQDAALSILADKLGATLTVASQARPIWW